MPRRLAVLFLLCASVPLGAADGLLQAEQGTSASKGPALSAEPAGAAAPAWTIGDELWDRPRSAEVIRALPAVRGAVAALLGTAGASLVIRHAAGQNDAQRAEEMRHWLVALAVEPGRILLVPVAGASVPGLPRGTLALELAR